jgi:hypothetical protein
MRRPKALLSVAAALVVLVAIVVGTIGIAGGSGDDEGKTATPAKNPAPSDAPGGSAAPPGALGRFPPQFIQCLEDRGVDVESLEGEDPTEIFHGGAVPPEVLNACFGVLHGGGGAP